MKLTSFREPLQLFFDALVGESEVNSPSSSIIFPSTPHSRHSIRSDPYLSTSRRADKARSIADFCCSSRATMPWSPPANSDRFQGDALTLVF